MKSVMVLLILATCLQGALWGQLRTARGVPPNPTYSPAVQVGRDPKEYLERAEGRISPDSPPELSAGPIALAAKAALEAGENDKAKDYAVKALTLANEVVAKQTKRGWPTPREYASVPTADFNANFVLGRLAILEGDTRSAERYLLAAGKSTGDPVLITIGPNMSLAQEVLKHGDGQSREAVLEFHCRWTMRGVWWRATSSITTTSA
jgi:hypothetical protein